MADLILPNGQTVSVSSQADIDEFMSRGAVHQSDAIAANPGQSIQDVASRASQQWNSYGGQGYLDAYLGGHNNPESDPRNPQPFASGTQAPPVDNTSASVVTGVTPQPPAVATDPLDDYIKGLLGDVDKTFKPGFENDLINDQTGQDLIGELLGQTFGDASTTLGYQRARGNLNDVGYARAQQDLASQRTANQSTLTEALSGLLSEGRRGLTDIQDKARNRAAGITSLDTPFDVSSYFGEAQNKADSFLGTLEGALRSRIDPATLFNPNAATQQGASVQGYVNPGSLAPERSRYATIDRGLGSRGGVF